MTFCFMGDSVNRSSILSVPVNEKVRTTNPDDSKSCCCETSRFSPQSSCIPFSYWKETVSVLLGLDRTSLCAIVRYIDEPFEDLDRDLLED